MSKLFLCMTSIVAMTLTAQAQGPRDASIGQSQLAPGEAGIAWYTTWETGIAEAKRSGRPIMFMAAATQCSRVSGVF